MEIGKLQWEDLHKIITENKSVKREDVRIRSAIGEDCSVMNFGEYECVMSTDPITGAEKNIGKLAVHINCNDVASCGVEPAGLLVTILIPPRSELKDVEEIMREIDEETKKLNVEILGGHTEVTDAVNRIVVSCTVIGKTKKDMAVATSGAQIGDDIIVTKKLCLEGTAIAVNDYYERVKEVLNEQEIEEARSYINELSVVKEGKISGEFGVNSMHDITEGGVLGGLWELAEGSKVGFKVYKEKMPISSVTQKICKLFSIDPLKFISSGSMLITCSNGKKLIEILKENGIDATIVGNITNKDRVIVEENKEYVAVASERDELFRII